MAGAGSALLISRLSYLGQGMAVPGCGARGTPLRERCDPSVVSGLVSQRRRVQKVHFISRVCNLAMSVLALRGAWEFSVADGGSRAVPAADAYRGVRPVSLRSGWSCSCRKRDVDLQWCCRRGAGAMLLSLWARAVLGSPLHKKRVVLSSCRSQLASHAEGGRSQQRFCPL